MALGDSDSNLLGDSLTDRRILKELVFLGIGDKSKLQQCRWPLVVMEHIVAGVFRPATMGAVAAGNLPQDIRGERCRA